MLFRAINFKQLVFRPVACGSGFRSNFKYFLISLRAKTQLRKLARSLRIFFDFKLFLQLPLDICVSAAAATADDSGENYTPNECSLDEFETIKAQHDDGGFGELHSKRVEKL